VTRRASRVRGFVAAAAASLAAAVLPCTARAQTPSAARLLDVPYLPQSEALCGGAAAAMVMRYWGATRIYPDAFASLVDRSAGGIRTDALADALRRRGWSTLVEAGTDADLTAELAQGRPVIALIAVARARYHYVVVLSRADGHTLVHDPARAPFQSIPDARFDVVWQATGRWMLTLLPPADLTEREAEPVELHSPPAPPACAALVDAGVRAAADDRARSRTLLARAADACPDGSAPWRELAGLDAIERNWTVAEQDAERAVERDSGDAYAWNLLATARFLQHEDNASLSAWNRIRAPLVDLINIEGLEKTRYRVVYDTVGLAPETLLTPGALRRAGRRVDDIPPIARARVAFHPVEQGRAQVDVGLVERDPYPRRWPSFAGMAAGAAVNRTIDASFANLTGGGERADLLWRWWDNRPAVAASLTAPAPRAFHGIWGVEVSHETETFGAARVRETRTHAALTGARWLTDRIRVDASAGLDRWAADGRFALFSGGLAYHVLSDRLTVSAKGSTWRGDRGFSAASLQAAWQSSIERSGALWIARAGVERVSAAAPRTIWPGAGTGHTRPALLRAHPLLDNGVVTGEAFGRRLITGGIEWQRWSRPGVSLVRYAPAVFVDIARAAHGLPETRTPTEVDVGAGFRVSLGGDETLRIDVAHGLRDGQNAVSVSLAR
jgi:hypothetical protein